MPTNGLSLVGFMDQETALKHLKFTRGHPPGTADAIYLNDWQNAAIKLGPPIQNAGNPQIVPIPPSDPYMQGLLHQSPWSAVLQDALARGGEFNMIEIDPLLAFQFTVDIDRSAHHCAILTKLPTRDELLNLSLPNQQTNDPVHISPQGQSFVIRSRSLNFRLLSQGALTPNAIGIQFGFTLPFVHVVRFNGRCYLHNGFHRTFGAHKAGATHIPCLFRDVQTPDEVGNAGAPTEAFSISLLESGNPPTLGHFTRGRAWNVKLPATSRIIHVSWSDHIMLEE